jgi:hypothetical protein
MDSIEILKFVSWVDEQLAPKDFRTILKPYVDKTEIDIIYDIINAYQTCGYSITVLYNEFKDTPDTQLLIEKIMNHYKKTWDDANEVIEASEINWCTCGHCGYKYDVNWDVIDPEKEMVCPKCDKAGEQGSDF